MLRALRCQIGAPALGARFIGGSSTAVPTATMASRRWSKFTIGATAGISMAAATSLAIVTNDGKAAVGKDGNPVYRVAITGGPCAGKSTGMAAIVTRMTGLGYNCYIVPETATTLITNGAPLSRSFSDEQMLNWETAWMKMQMAVEDAFIMIAKMSGKPSIVLMDRGCMDSMAYMSKDLWATLLHDNGLNETQLRDQRYDAVVHMVTAADGAEKFYTTQNNMARSETAEEARKVDLMLQNAYLGHNHIRVVDNSTDFKGKIHRVTEAICHLVGEPLPCQGERKYVVKSVDAIPSEITVKNVFIEEHYLEDGRVRKQGTDGLYHYTYSNLKKTSKGYAISERPITGREYTTLIKNGGGTVVVKNRMVFLYRNQYFQLDKFVTVDGRPSNVQVMQVEVDSLDVPVNLPPFVHIDKDVTELHDVLGLSHK